MDQSKYDQMQGMLNKLEDIKNSQESILDKINHVITDLFQNPDKDLEKAMENAHEKASENVEEITEAIEEFEMKFNKAQQE
jgi:archaellum component FlaC